MLLTSCWKGLFKCLDEASIDALEYISHIEKCMEMLFSLLPARPLSSMVGVDQLNYLKERSEAVSCLGKARRHWLVNFLQVSQNGLRLREDRLAEVLKKIQARAKLVRFGSIPLTELGTLKSLILDTESDGIWDMLVEVLLDLQDAEKNIKRQWLINAAEISCVSSYPSTALKFLGLLSGSWSKYMPLMILDQQSLLSDLSVTISSLLSDSSWGGIAETIISSLFASTGRLYNWSTHLARGMDLPSDMQPIDETENPMVGFLLCVMHSTCVTLKDYLSLEKQLKLSNMDITLVT